MAAIDLTQLPGWTSPQDITTLMASGSLTITSTVVFKTGSDVVFKITYSDSSVTYLKVKQGRVKVGGSDTTFETGTEVTWQS